MDYTGLPCQNCTGTMAPVIYGYPGPELIQLAKDEAIALGGLRNDGYTHYCYSCNEVYPFMVFED